MDSKLYPRGTGAPRSIYNATLGFDVVQGQANVLRTRLTTAQCNAGATLLPAIPNLGIHVYDITLVAIGGNAGTATSVDINATRAGAAVKLLVAAVAGLTRSAVLRAGATNAAVLADGASFIVNDDNTAVTLSVDANNLATATAIDVFLRYAYE